jgi:mycofactocin system glycosyltransferase
VRACETPLLAFVDSDCVPSAGWLAGLLPHFADPVVGAVAPRIVALDSRGALAAYERVRSPLDMGSREASARPDGVVPYVPSAALVVRREALGSGFDEALRLGEDVDLVWRLVGAGWTVRYVPEVDIPHDHRTELVEWLRTRVAYNASAAPLEQRHPGTIRAAHVTPWGAAAWTAGAAGAPLVATALAAMSGGLAYRRLCALAPEAAGQAGSMVIRGAFRDGAALAAAFRGPWAPFALAAAILSRRARHAAAAALVVPPLVQWARTRPRGVGPATYTALRGLDDLARGAGVWAGCLRHGILAPLCPRIRRASRSA